MATKMSDSLNSEVRHGTIHSSRTVWMPILSLMLTWVQIASRNWAPFFRPRPGTGATFWGNHFEVWRNLKRHISAPKWSLITI